MSVGSSSSFTLILSFTLTGRLRTTNVGALSTPSPNSELISAAYSKRPSSSLCYRNGRALKAVGKQVYKSCNHSRDLSGAEILLNSSVRHSILRKSFRRNSEGMPCAEHLAPPACRRANHDCCIDEQLNEVDLNELMESMMKHCELISVIDFAW